TALPYATRSALHLKGLVPSGVEDFSVQEQRALEQLNMKSTNLEKYIFLSWLRTTNINLFYRLVLHNLKAIAPVIYTPTVGQACQEYSHIYPFLAPPNNVDGLYIPLTEVENIGEIIGNYRESIKEGDEPEITVITDGSRILGLGDLGMNGMGIPVGKLQLYVAAAGLNPDRSGIPPRDQRILFVGAGSAGTGVAKQLVDYFVIEHKIPAPQAQAMFWFVDSHGLITANRGDTLPHHKVSLARQDNGSTQCATIEEALEYVKPTALIGLSTIYKAFSEKILTRMSEINSQARPIIFPLSNPETKAECSFEEAMRCTNNRVLFASGTAFPEYTDPETCQVFVPGQGNNMYVFPAIGLGAVLCKPTCITDTMIYAVSKALAASLNSQEKADGELYPRIERIREVSAELAAAFIQQAVREDLAKDQKWIDLAKACEAGKLVAEVRRFMWLPAETFEQLRQCCPHTHHHPVMPHNHEHPVVPEVPAGKL
ncbi:hypothetical protein GGH95_001011, partial [Coemansia sp. RSA 1836]